jgi:Ion channel
VNCNDSARGRSRSKNEAQLKMTQSDTTTGLKNQARAGLFRFSMAQFLVALILLLVLYPFIVEVEHGEVIESILMMIILISAVLAVGGRSWVLTIALVIPALAGPWLDHYWPGTVPVLATSCARMVFLGFVVSQLLRFILRSTRVNSEVMCAGISAYLMLGLWWTSAYLTISQLNPASFSGVHLVANRALGRFDALYFSFVSLTCLGCSDITPISKVARMLLMVESTTGVLYLAVLIARLVALYSHSVEKGLDQQTKT